MAGFLWSLLMFYLLATSLTGPLDADIRNESAEIVILFLLVASNTFFCAVGARNRGIGLKD